MSLGNDIGQSREHGLREHGLRERLANLEKQVLELRREIRDEAAKPLPSGAFAALEVRVRDSWYLVPITSIREVLQMLWPKPLPEAPEWVLGTFLYGDRSVALIDLRTRLQAAEDTPATDRLDPAATVLVSSSEPPSAFVVDEIRDLMNLDPKHVAPPSPGIPQAPFLAGAVRIRGEMLVHLLSLDLLCREVPTAPDDTAPDDTVANATAPDDTAPDDTAPDDGGADEDG